MKTQEFIDTDLIPNAQTSSASAKHLVGSPSQSRAEIDARVEQARQQMLELRRQQEELEHERQELEDLRRREEEFESGKAEMLEELSKTITLIEQEEFEINKRSGTLSSCREAYQDYVRQLQDIRENDWSGDELKSQLAKAIAVVEAARSELNKGRAQLSFLGEGPLKLAHDPVYSAPPPAQPSHVSESFDFKLEFQRGLARNLALILSLSLILIIFLLRK